MTGAEPSSAPILLDGALATELVRRGFALSEPRLVARALDEAPDLLTAIHLDYVRAGAQVVSTNSFELHARKLAAVGHGERQRELAEISVAVIEAARAQARVEDLALASFRVAGSIPPVPPTSDGAEPNGELDRAEYRSLANALVSAGADLILFETFWTAEQAQWALEAVAGIGVPVWLAVAAGRPRALPTERPDGSRLVGGDPLEDLFDRLADLEPDAQPDALLINCTQIDAVPEAVATLTRLADARASTCALGLYPHLGRARHDGVWIDRIVEPRVFAEQMQAWVDRWPALSVVGACCGSTPDYIAALRRCAQPTDHARRSAGVRLAELVP